MVESKRIDIDALHDIIQQHLVSGGGHELDSLHAELQRMYAREDELLEALRIIRDDLDEEIAKALVAAKNSAIEPFFFIYKTLN